MRASDQIVRFVRVCVLVGLFAGQAHAEGDATRFSLSWTRLPGAEQCIPARALARAVEARLQHPAFGGPGESEVGIEGRVERAGTGWHAVVSLVNDSGAILGTREVSSAGPSCRELDAPLTFIVALFVDPNAGKDLAEPPGSLVPPAVAPSPEVAQPAAPPPPSAPAPPEPWRSWAALGGGLALGVLPEPSPELVLRLGVLPPHAWPVVLSGALLHEESRSPGADAEPIAFSLATGGLAVCPLHGAWRAGALRACAGVDAGVATTRGLAGGAILVRRRFALSAVGRVEGALNLGAHGFLAAGAGLMVPLVRDFFDYERDGDRTLVYRMAPVGAAFDFGVGFRVP